MPESSRYFVVVVVMVLMVVVVIMVSILFPFLPTVLAVLKFCCVVTTSTMPMTKKLDINNLHVSIY